MTKESYLKSLKTRQLMSLRQQTFAMNGKFLVEEHGFYVTNEDIKDELSTRDEHIPNKQEARQIRQEKAKG